MAEELTVFGLKVFEIEPFGDSRGEFIKLWNLQLSKRFDDFIPEEVSLSKNRLMGTVRGLHTDLNKFGLRKIIYCLEGKVRDITVDLRPESPTYLKKFDTILTANSRKIILIPPGCGHIYQTLSDSTSLLYFHNKKINEYQEYKFNHASSAFDIKWNLEISNISDDDKFAIEYRPLK